MSELIYAVEGVQIVTAPPDMARAALWYATKWEWAVFPCAPRAKTPLTPHGLQDATTDVERIKAWAQRWPDANWAAPTGTAQQGGIGFDVVDVDGDPGRDSLANLEADGELPPILATVFTPGDPSRSKAPGRHLYIAAQGQRNGTAVWPGIDLRADGGFVMIPPSVGPHGVGYTWLVKPDGKP